MKTVLRSILAIVLGLIVGSLVIAVIEIADAAAFGPADPEVFKDPQKFAAFVDEAPPALFILLLTAYAVGTFVGAFVAARIAGVARMTHGMVIGVLFLLAGISNLLALPHPLWVAIGTIVVFLPAAYLGAWTAQRLATAKSA